MRSGRRPGAGGAGEDGRFRPAGWVGRTAAVGRLVEARTGRLVRLEASDVQARVARRVGRAIDADDPGLRVLLADVARAGLTPLGRAWMRSELVRRGVTVELLADEIRRRPELLQTTLRTPLVVVGLPRTGTTLLHALLGCDPDAVVFPFWQLRRPYPLQYAGRQRSVRIAQAAMLARLARSMAPRLREVHPVAALSPEEDVFLRRDNAMLATPLAAPGRLAWVQDTDQTTATVAICRRCCMIDRGGGRF